MPCKSATGSCRRLEPWVVKLQLHELCHTIPNSNSSDLNKSAESWLFIWTQLEVYGELQGRPH